MLLSRHGYHKKQFRCQFILHGGPINVASDEIRVRFAPSPTGSLHVGGVRTYLYNYLFAKKNKGAIILRLDDTDTERLDEGSEYDILEGLRWLGLQWDEGIDAGGNCAPYNQLARKEIYSACANRLIAENKAYYCFCSKEEIDMQRKKLMENKMYYKYNKKCSGLDNDTIKHYIDNAKPFAIRLRSSAFENDDFVIIRSNGLATYNFACAVDDALMKISHVIRGLDHLSNTEKQQQIIDALGYQRPLYIHCSLLMDNTEKLSKSTNNFATLTQLRSKGIHPKVLISYLVRLGTGFSDEKTCTSLDKLAEEFSIDQLKTSAIEFDFNKLLWLNREYLASLNKDEFMEQMKMFVDYFNYSNTDYPMESLLEISKQCFDILITGVSTFEDYLINLIESLKYRKNELAAIIYKDMNKAQVNSAKAFLKWFSDYTNNYILSNGSPEDQLESFKSIFINKHFPQEFQCTNPLRLIRIALTGTTSGVSLLNLIQLWQVAEKQKLTNFITLKERINFINNML
ncbi:bifunctional Glutamate-tRNA ligase [Babesia duncani]|uniref:glutamate--tRNA ligase n=1 Tax=Babesia duncani TaxID=323732 RepID=A0AAD9PJ15_9APIC|nr:bifunctional Glutamate-tRNA ligase [Babesia duncani]